MDWYGDSPVFPMTVDKPRRVLGGDEPSLTVGLPPRRAFAGDEPSLRVRLRPQRGLAGDTPTGVG